MPCATRLEGRKKHDAPNAPVRCESFVAIDSFVLAAWMVTLMLRGNRAQVRYAVWLAASVKFLLPFSALMSIRGHLGWRAVSAAPSLRLPFIVEEASWPFSPAAPDSTAAAPAGISWMDLIPPALCILWMIGAVAIFCPWWKRWEVLGAVLRNASEIDLNIGVKTLVSPAFSEPGVFGVRRPLLLLPAGITDRL